jgi:hypothetical protein
MRSAGLFCGSVAFSFKSSGSTCWVAYIPTKNRRDVCATRDHPLAPSYCMRGIAEFRATYACGGIMSDN